MHDAAVVETCPCRSRGGRTPTSAPSPPGDSSRSRRRLGPATNSITTNGRPWSLCRTSKMLTRCGFFRFMHWLMPQLDLLVPVTAFSHLAAAVAERVVHLAEPAAAGGPPNREAGQRLVPVLVLECPHGRPTSRSVSRAELVPRRSRRRGEPCSDPDPSTAASNLPTHVRRGRTTTRVAPAASAAGPVARPSRAFVRVTTNDTARLHVRAERDARPRGGVAAGDEDRRRLDEQPAVAEHQHDLLHQVVDAHAPPGPITSSRSSRISRRTSARGYRARSGSRTADVLARWQAEREPAAPRRQARARRRRREAGPPTAARWRSRGWPGGGSSPPRPAHRAADAPASVISPTSARRAPAGPIVTTGCVSTT